MNRSIDISRIVKKVAHERFKLVFADGLIEQLAEDIRLKYRDLIPQTNGGLAVNLAEFGFRRLADRLVQTGACVRDEASHVLIAEDFGIGDPTVSIIERMDDDDVRRRCPARFGQRRRS